MYKKLLTLLGISLLSLVCVSNSFAANPSPTVEPTPLATPLNSFEAFWPLVAGKTQGDSTYFLKIWKENIRGWFIFGGPEKAEYQTFIATKRVLEAENLINNSKFDLATSTEQAANSNLSKALNTLSNSSDISDEIKSTVKNRLDNLIKLVDELAVKTKDQSTVNNQVNSTHDLITKILPLVTPKS